MKCIDPCPGACGVNAECFVRDHSPICQCFPGYVGDPFRYCNPIPPQEVKVEPPRDPCNPSPCGANAVCKVQNGAASCSCLPEYFGDAYVQCTPECVINSDCPRDKACLRNKCKDPCPGVCGVDAICEVYNHVPTCTCPEGYTGDPFSYCRIAPTQPPPSRVVLEPCSPNPCGPHSICREYNEQAVCSCQDGYIGSPPQCRPECVVNCK